MPSPSRSERRMHYVFGFSGRPDVRPVDRLYDRSYHYNTSISTKANSDRSSENRGQALSWMTLTYFKRSQRPIKENSCLHDISTPIICIASKLRGYQWSTWWNSKSNIQDGWPCHLDHSNTAVNTHLVIINIHVSTIWDHSNLYDILFLHQRWVFVSISNNRVGGGGGDGTRPNFRCADWMRNWTQ